MRKVLISTAALLLAATPSTAAARGPHRSLPSARALVVEAAADMAGLDGGRIRLSFADYHLSRSAGHAGPKAWLTGHALIRFRFLPAPAERLTVRSRRGEAVTKEAITGRRYCHRPGHGSWVCQPGLRTNTRDILALFGYPFEFPHAGPDTRAALRLGGLCTVRGERAWRVEAVLGPRAFRRVWREPGSESWTYWIAEGSPRLLKLSFSQTMAPGLPTAQRSVGAESVRWGRAGPMWAPAGRRSAAPSRATGSTKRTG